MGLPSFTVNQDVIAENQDTILKIWLQDFIHETLKFRWSITKSKVHDQKLIVPFMGTKICLGDINLFHLDMVRRDVVAMLIRDKMIT